MRKPTTLSASRIVPTAAFAILVGSLVHSTTDGRRSAPADADAAAPAPASAATPAAPGFLDQPDRRDPSQPLRFGSPAFQLIPFCPPPTANTCNPFPPEDVGEVPEPGGDPRTRWTFDDNKFCVSGPGIDCTGTNPGTDFCDSPAPFEMYILADCGTEMHLPLFDVESGCVSLLLDNAPAPPTPITIRVQNGLPVGHPMHFDQTGTTVCWAAQDCTGMDPALCNQNDPNGFEVPPNCPGGPGDQVTMDVSFEGMPALCGVYIARLSSWGGCAWDLLSNCDGTSAEHFTIYHSICSARAAYDPLPQLIVENLTLSDAGGCSVDYCVDVENIGCVANQPFTITVTNGDDTDSQTVPAGLAAGATVQICGNLLVTPTGSVVTTTVTAEVDPGDTLLECSEDTTARSCAPTQGSHTATATQDVVCNSPPECDAGGPYSAECTGAAGGTQISVDGSGSSDPDGNPLTFAWTTDCPGGTFNDPAAVSPVLTVPGAHCDLQCTVFLTVTDTSSASASCSAPVTITDTTPPVVTGCAFEPASPLPPGGPGSPASPAAPRPPASPLPPASPASCDSNGLGLVRVRCGTAAEACSPPVTVTAEVHVRRLEVVDGACTVVEETHPVDCDELLDLRTLPPPCLGPPPRAPRPPGAPGSAGSPGPPGPRVIAGQEITLRVTATDSCGNASVGCTAMLPPAPCAPPRSACSGAECTLP